MLVEQAFVYELDTLELLATIPTPANPQASLCEDPQWPCPYTRVVGYDDRRMNGGLPLESYHFSRKLKSSEKNAFIHAKITH